VAATGCWQTFHTAFQLCPLLQTDKAGFSAAKGGCNRLLADIQYCLSALPFAAD